MMAVLHKHRALQELSPLVDMVLARLVLPPTSRAVPLQALAVMLVSKRMVAAAQLVQLELTPPPEQALARLVLPPTSRAVPLQT